MTVGGGGGGVDDGNGDGGKECGTPKWVKNDKQL